MAYIPTFHEPGTTGVVYQPKSMLTSCKGAPTPTIPNGLSDLELFLKAQQCLRYRETVCTHQSSSSLTRAPTGGFYITHLAPVKVRQTHPQELPRATYRHLRIFSALQRENHVSQLGAVCGQWRKFVASRELNIGLPATSKEKTWAAGSSYALKSVSVEYRYSLREAHLYTITRRKESLQNYETERQTERLLSLEKHLESFPWGDCSQFISAEEKSSPHWQVDSLCFSKGGGHAAHMYASNLLSGRKEVMLLDRLCKHQKPKT